VPGRAPPQTFVAHSPEEQVWPLAQSLSIVQEPLPPSASSHSPFLQAPPAAQPFPQEPQFAGSDSKALVGWQTPSQHEALPPPASVQGSAVAAPAQLGGSQKPLWQVLPLGQMRPQPPQFSGSDWISRQDPEQQSP
jgi:hypothetical protein